jgi:hypothetical protein
LRVSISLAGHHAVRRCNERKHTRLMPEQPPLLTPMRSTRSEPLLSAFSFFNCISPASVSVMAGGSAAGASVRRGGVRQGREVQAGRTRGQRRACKGARKRGMAHAYARRRRGFSAVGDATRRIGQERTQTASRRRRTGCACSRDGGAACASSTGRGSREAWRSSAARKAARKAHPRRKVAPLVR